MSLLQKTKELCRLYEIKPTRTKGQNFLINEEVYDKIVAAAGLEPGDSILEVGPGLGFLTAKLGARVKEVVAVELDDKLAAFLDLALKSQNIENIKIINSDILKFSWEEERPYKIVANLPYNISSFFLRRFLSAERPPTALVLLLQKEVAERIVAPAGEMSLLAVSVQYFATAEIIASVPARDFWPEPKVASAIIRIRPKAKNAKYKDRAQEDKFFRLLRVGFSAKRKMLKNNLAAGLNLDVKALEDALVFKGFNPKVRAEDLSLAEWHKLFAALASFML